MFKTMVAYVLFYMCIFLWFYMAITVTIASINDSCLRLVQFLPFFLCHSTYQNCTFSAKSGCYLAMADNYATPYIHCWLVKQGILDIVSFYSSTFACIVITCF